jgi:predicted O-methyltransferase YrrM
MKSRDELPELLNSLNLIGVGVEVGSSYGDFAKIILNKWLGKKLWLVDSWRHFEGIDDINNPDHNGQLDALAHCFMQMYRFDAKVGIIRDLSIVSAELFKDASLDFVYIDAAHDYQSVKQDLKAWYPKVKKGGVFAGHDYALQTIVFSQNDMLRNCVLEVKPAVDEFVQEYSLDLNVTEDEYPSWWVVV